MKFIPRCQLSVEVLPDTRGITSGNVVFPPECTIEFEITRQFWSGSQTAYFRVMNLAPRTRNLVQKDVYAIAEYRNVQFRAGYDQFLPLCFNGRVETAYSDRQGVDVVTEIRAYDGGQAMANGFTSLAIGAGTSVQQVLNQLARSLPGLGTQPVIGTFPGATKRASVLFGNTWSIILAQSRNLACIDNGQVKILQTNEAISGAQIPVITSESGLLGVPRRTETSLQIQMIFEPRLTVGQVVELRSTSAPQYNGLYKVSGFTHRGIISPAVDGPRVSTVNLFFGNGEFQMVQGALAQ